MISSLDLQFQKCEKCLSNMEFLIKRRNLRIGMMDIYLEVQKSIIPGLLPIISIITVRRNHIGPIPVIMRSFGRS